MSEPILTDMRRRLVVEALDGALVQLAAAGRFLARGDDVQANSAFARGVNFVRIAAPEMKALGPATDSMEGHQP